MWFRLFLLVLGIVLPLIAQAPEDVIVPVLPDSLLLNPPAQDTVASSVGDSSESPPEDSTQVKSAEIISYKGLVLSSLAGQPVEGAEVHLNLSGKYHKLTTDGLGLFLFPQAVVAGDTLRIVKKGFEEFYRLFSGPLNQRIIEFKISRPVKTLSLVRANKKIDESSAFSLMEERKKAKGISNTMGKEEIGKSTDSDAGAIAKRISGTSLIGGKYVFVRGLGERYTNMLLNGLPVPSPEKDKRIVPQDLFPAGAIDFFTIHKTFNTHLLPDFAGGSIEITTKGIPDKTEYSLKAGASGTDYRGDGSFMDIGFDRITYDGGSRVTNYFGFDDGTRAIPGGVPTIVPKGLDRDERALYAYQFNNKLALDTGTIVPNQSYSFSYQWVKENEDQTKLGYLLDVGFSNDYKQEQYQRIIWKPNYIVADEVYYIENAAEHQIGIGEYSTKLSALANFGYENPNWDIWFKNLYARLSTDRAFYNTALQTRGGPGAGMDSPWEERFTLSYNSRQFLSSQVGGGAFIGKGLADSLSWATGFAYTTAESPDKKRYYYTRNVSYERVTDTTEYEGKIYMPGEEILHVDPELRYELKPPYGTRAWEDTWEYNITGRADLNLVVPPSISKKEVFRTGAGFFNNVRLPKGKVGYLGYFKMREFDLTRYSWDGIQSSSLLDEWFEGDSTVDGSTSLTGDYAFVERIHDPAYVYESLTEASRNGFQTTPKEYDAYNAFELNNSVYLHLEQDFNLGRVPSGLYGGVRAEQFWLNFEAPFTGESSYDNPSERTEKAKVVDNKEFHFFPTVAWYSELTRKSKLTLQYSKTIVRPEIRERAPTEYFDTEKDRFIIGQPDLKNTDIHNYDIRLDWFVRLGQIISGAVFYKTFANPIEGYIDPNNSPNVKRFLNSKSAYVRGVEFEWLLNLSLFVPRNFPLVEYLDNISLSGNVSLMRSEVTVDTSGAEEARGFVGILHLKRPMVGQSDYLINNKILHTPNIGKLGITHGAAYNVFGPRIEEVGAFYLDDIYEDSFHSLDYFAKFDYGRWGLSFKTVNLLDSPVRYYVDGLDQDTGEVKRKVIYTRKKGTGYSLSLGLKF